MQAHKGPQQPAYYRTESARDSDRHPRKAQPPSQACLPQSSCRLPSHLIVLLVWSAVPILTRIIRIEDQSLRACSGRPATDG